MGRPEDLPMEFRELAEAAGLKDIDIYAGPTEDPKLGKDEVHVIRVEKLDGDVLTTLYEGPIPRAGRTSIWPD